MVPLCRRQITYGWQKRDFLLSVVYMVHAGYNFVGKNIGEGYNGFDGIVNSFFSSAANRARFDVTRRF